MSAVSSALDKFLKPTQAAPTEPANGQVAGVGNVVNFPGSREKSLNKTVGLMALGGKGANEIAEVLGLTVPQVMAIFDTPEVVGLFRAEAVARGKYVLKTLARGAATDAFITIHDIARNPRHTKEEVAAARLQLAACQELLDRAFGKPSQKHQLEEEGDLGEGNPEEALKLIRDQIAELQTKRPQAS